MPNWIEGTMKLRGKRVDIKRFINEGIQGYDFLGENKRPKTEYIKDNSTCDEIDFEIFNDPHVNGTRRMFVLPTSAYMYNEEGVCVFNIRQAWSFSARDTDIDNLIAIADKYQVDIRLFGIERGVEFMQEVIVHHGSDSEKGKLKLNNCISFENWEWECPFPGMGG